MNRIKHLDSAKGIGIILVILGHLLTISSFPERLIYSFHMPLFFLLSGSFANAGKFTFKDYLIRNVKRLLIPYTLFFVIGLCTTLLLFQKGELFSFKQILYSFATTPRLVNMNPIWFLTCLFDVTLLFYPIYRLFIAKDNMLALLIILVGLIIASPVITKLCEYYGIVILFKWDVAFSALPFYVLGFLLRERIIQVRNLKNKLLTMIICIVISALVSYKNGLVAMVNNSYGKDLLWYILGAVCGIVFVIIAGYYLKEIRALRYIGKNSLVIFAIHMLLIRIYTSILSKVINESKIAQENLTAVQIIMGFLIVFSLCILITIVWNYLRGYTHKKRLL